MREDQEIGRPKYILARVRKQKKEEAEKREELEAAARKNLAIEEARAAKNAKCAQARTLPFFEFLKVLIDRLMGFQAIRALFIRIMTLTGVSEFPSIGA